MMPMMPKISVNPLATRNSNSPYWMPFRSWIRKDMDVHRAAPGSGVAKLRGPDEVPARDRALAALELAAPRRVGKILDWRRR
jgi:hypothetical protein